MTVSALRRRLAQGLLALPAAGLARAGSPVLRVLAWPGYAEPEVVAQFEQAHRARVELTVVDSDEVLWTKLNARPGQAADVLAINTAELQRAIRARLIRPVEQSRIPALRRQLARFQHAERIPGLVHLEQGQPAQYAVPFTYAEMGLIYDRQQFASAPDSIQALWDPRWRGKVLLYNGGSHNFSLAAQSLGLPQPFRLAQPDWPRALERLIALRRNALAFYSQPEESVRLFKRHRAALMFANYGNQQLQLLRQAGVDVGYALPREGALAWLDCWAITRACAQPALAHAWIDHLLGAQASALLRSRQGLASTTEEGGSSANAKLVWLEPVEDVAQRESLWARIRSGDRSARLMGP